MLLEQAEDLIVVHSIPGRVRVRFRDRMDGQLRAVWQSPPGIIDARANPACRCVVVRYDIAQISVDAVMRWLREPPSATTPRTNLIDTSPSHGALWTLGIAAAGLALSLFGAPAIVTIGVVAAGAFPIAMRAVADLRRREVSADFLDAVAVGVLLLLASFIPAALSAFLIAAGEYIRALTARRSQKALVDLFASTARFAWVLREGRWNRVSADSVTPGTMVLVHPGELVPVDGRVALGRATIDEQALTGEATPRVRAPGDMVYASTVVMDGELQVKTERSGKETRASRILQILASAPVHDTKIGNYAARFASRFVVPVLLLAGGIYLLTRDIVRATSIIVFDFSTGIRVSVPTCVLAAMSAAIRRQVLIKGGRALEQLARVDTIVFDKTGTLTSGKPVVTEIISLVDDLDEDDLLALAAAVEHGLSHPAAQAIVRAAEERTIAVPDRGHSRYEIGLGVHTHIDGIPVIVGSERFLTRCGVELADDAVRRADELDRDGTSAVFVAYDGRAAGIIAYADVPRAEIAMVIRDLRNNGIDEIVMVTGDQHGVARAIASQVGIQRVEAESFPDRKAAIVRELQAQGHVVAVVGDGINDSPALAYADVSVSLAGGTDVARETADVVLYGDLSGLLEAIAMARFAMQVVRQDLGIVGIANGLGLLGATAGFVAPALATAINNGSGVLAAMNSLRPLVLSAQGSPIGARAARYP